MREGFKSIAVSGPESSLLLFGLRAFADLQFRTIRRDLRRYVPTLTGRGLDVAAGNSPWRYLLGRGTTHTGLDLAGPDLFGLQHNPDEIVRFDGDSFPFDDGVFDAALCIEVLEHVSEPARLISEIQRALVPEGRLVLTVPRSARRHYIPHDYYRYSREPLSELLASGGFVIEELIERGSDISASASRLVVGNLVLLRPRATLILPVRILAGIVLLPFAVISIVIAHLAITLGAGSSDDPLGYSVLARSRT